MLKFKDGKYNGKGTYYYADGRRYEGEYKDDVRNGKGTYYYADGNKFKEEWNNNERVSSVPF
jgi:hypothetical protein